LFGIWILEFGFEEPDRKWMAWKCIRPFGEDPKSRMIRTLEESKG
jgi:hypothetical protein